MSSRTPSTMPMSCSSTPVYPAGEEPIEGVDSDALGRRPSRSRASLGAHGRGPDGTLPRAARPCRRGRHDHLHGRGRHHQMGGWRSPTALPTRGRRNERRRHHAPGSRQADRQRPARTARLVQERRQCRMAVRAEGRGRSRRASFASSIRDVPVMALGLGSNLIVRDGGVPGVVVRLGKAFARIEPSR